MNAGRRTWTIIITIIVFCICVTVAMTAYSKSNAGAEKQKAKKDEEVGKEDNKARAELGPAKESPKGKCPFGFDKPKNGGATAEKEKEAPLVNNRKLKATKNNLASREKGKLCLEKDTPKNYKAIHALDKKFLVRQSLIKDSDSGNRTSLSDRRHRGKAHRGKRHKRRLKRSIRRRRHLLSRWVT